MAISGCSLYPDHESPNLIYADGIPYEVGASFNKHGIVTDIKLTYQKEGEISADECQNIHSRTIDWYSAEFLPLRFKQRRSLSQFTTKSGIEYGISKSVNNDWISDFSYTVPKDSGKPITVRHAYLFSTYIVVNNKPHCTVGLSISEPDSVERKTDR